MNVKKIKNLIIGAGISGLTYAVYCKDDYLIVEKDKNIGGYCKTISRNGYTWDYSGHFYHFKTDEFKKLFLEYMKNKKIIYNNKCTKILYGGSFIDYPFQSNIHQLKKEEFIDCLYDLYFREKKDHYDNFLDMLYGKFGNSIVNKFLRPYNEKLYSVDLCKLDQNAMGRFFPYANLDEIVKNMKANDLGTYNSKFLYPANGTFSFVEEIYSKLDKSKIVTNCSIEKIDLKHKKAILSNGLTIEYENLINTIPLNMFLLLLDNNYQSIVNKMTYNQVLVLNMGFDKASPICKKEHWIYIPSKNVNYYRVGFYNNILGQEKLSIYVEIGYDSSCVINKKVIEDQVKLTLTNLQNDGIISEDMKLIDYEPIVMCPAYVHINTQVDNELSAIKENLSKENIYTIGRYGAWTYNSMEDCMIMAKELAIKLNEGDVKK